MRRACVRGGGQQAEAGVHGPREGGRIVPGQGGGQLEQPGEPGAVPRHGVPGAEEADRAVVEQDHVVGARVDQHEARARRGDVRADECPGHGLRVGGVVVGERGAVEPGGDQHGGGGELRVGLGDHEVGHVAERAADGALLRRLVLEVELVERLGADAAQQRGTVEPRERRRQRRAEGVEQRQVGAQGGVEAWPAHLDRHLGAVEDAAVDLRHGRHGRGRVEVEVVEHLPRRAAPGVAQRLLHRLAAERDARLLAGAVEGRGERREPRRERVGREEAGGAAEQQPAVRGLPQQRGAHVEEHAQRGRDVGAHPGYPAAPLRRRLPRPVGHGSAFGRERGTR